jgi:hypothetical protein
MLQCIAYKIQQGHPYKKANTINTAEKNLIFITYFIKYHRYLFYHLTLKLCLGLLIYDIIDLNNTQQPQFDKKLQVRLELNAI